MKFALMPRALIQWLFPLLIALISMRFLLGVAETMPHMMSHFDLRPVALYAHLIFAPVALALVPFQFWRRLRNERKALHRWLGRAYGMSILISGGGALALAPNSQFGPVASWGFGILAALWLFSTGYGIFLAMQRRIAEHQKWIIRSAALTFAAVTLRLYFPFLAMGFDLDTGYKIVAWLCWVPNLLLAEYLIRTNRIQRL